MPDSVTCRVDVSGSSIRVNCEPDPDPAAPASSKDTTPANRSLSPSPPQADHAPTAELVKRFTPKLAVQPQIPSKLPEVEYAPIALRCVGEISGVPLAMIGATPFNPAVGVLGGFKAGYDLGKCIGVERNAALQSSSDARAVAECNANGGTPAGITSGVLACLVTKKASQ